MMMNRIFVNLKRFEVPRCLGGICSHDNPEQWIRDVLKQTIGCGLGKLPDMELIYLLPEALLLSARNELESHPRTETNTIRIGCQGIYRENIAVGGNFGAFTTILPAAAAANLGAEWAIIGHSEERQDKRSILTFYDSEIKRSKQALLKSEEAVNLLINQETLRAFESGINVLLCIGETASQRGYGTFKAQQPRIQAALRSQAKIGLAETGAYLEKHQIVIGYEPIWAIGPGKNPPTPEYIDFVSDYIKTTSMELYGYTPPVVYGGGLKAENVEEIAGIHTIDGGLVALTKFIQPIGFDPEELQIIVEKYRQRKNYI